MLQQNLFQGQTAGAALSPARCPALVCLAQTPGSGEVWPVLPGSERPPADWPGWPDGKKFAFVLTHDVEGQAGLDRCRSLMELEAKLNFRSSFNFIPEGEYRVSKELRDELTGRGFEVGVHDLRHDGKLYIGKRKEFASQRQPDQPLPPAMGRGRVSFRIHVSQT